MVDSRLSDISSTSTPVATDILYMTNSGGGTNKRVQLDDAIKKGFPVVLSGIASNSTPVTTDVLMMTQSTGTSATRVQVDDLLKKVIPPSLAGLTSSATPPASDILLATDSGGTTMERISVGSIQANAVTNINGNNFTLHGFEGNINTVATAAYTTVTSDNGKLINMTSSAAGTLTVIANAPAGYNFGVIQSGAGQVTIASNGNVRNRSTHTKIAGQYGIGTVFVLSNTNTAPEAYLAGDTSA